MEIKKIFKAEVAHKLVSAFSKDCLNVHGHSYTYDVVLESGELNGDGMVMDFGEVKSKAKAFMDSFDHCLVLTRGEAFTNDMLPLVEKHNLKCMLVPYNSTAEYQACHIYQQLHEYGLLVKSVTVHETLTGSAMFDGSDDVQNIYVDLDQVSIYNA